MFSLKSRQDNFRLLLPKEFICDEIVEKYTKVLQDAHSFYTTPIDFLNETIQGVQVLGFTGGTVQQQQPGRGAWSKTQERKPQNTFLHTATDYNYRSEVSPVALIDKTLNVTFRHTLGFVNYFLLFENFFWQYMRDKEYKELVKAFYIDIANEKGEVYARIMLADPVIDSMDMLDLNFTQPVASSQTFNVVFKYSNIDFIFIQNSDEPEDEMSDTEHMVNEKYV